MKPGVARALVAASSAAVLVLEILAGRLLAPYVGVSLETFTGIIGVVLAGIATGAWAGGALADRYDATKMIGGALTVGGVLTWLVLPLLGALGPQFDDGAVAIVMLSTIALFLPSAVLSAISPMVAKLTLGDLRTTGAVIGGLSAAGTLGALAGTFITGFLLVSALPTRTTVIVLGALLVVAGAAVHAMLVRTVPPASAAALVVMSGLLGAVATEPCEFATSYFCANIVDDEAPKTGRSLYLDGLRHAYVDLTDPTNLDIRYIRLFAQVADSLEPGPLDTLHVGGGGFSFPRYLQHVRPGSTDHVLEIDRALVDLVKDELGLVPSEQLQVRVGDARLALDEFDDNTFDLAVGDAFSSRSVPWHLTTREFLQQVDRVLSLDGIYVMNVIDRGDVDFIKAELATLSEIFEVVTMITPPGGFDPARSANTVLIASHHNLPDLEIAIEDGVLRSQAETAEFIAGAASLRDDFAPVDQLQD